jgi:hypothetical protein
LFFDLAVKEIVRVSDRQSEAPSTWRGLSGPNKSRERLGEDRRKKRGEIDGFKGPTEYLNVSDWD